MLYHIVQWREDGIWDHGTRTLCEGWRGRIGRAPQPTAAIIDSQSVTTTEISGPRAYDGGKKVKGRQRHLLVGTQGTRLGNKVHPADIHNRAGDELLLEGLKHLFPAIDRIWADTAYCGLKVWLQKALGWRLSIPQHWWSGGVWMNVGSDLPPRPSGFQVLACRWVGERTTAWSTTNRRLPKAHQRLAETGAMLLYLAMSRILLRRLLRKER